MAVEVDSSSEILGAEKSNTTDFNEAFIEGKDVRFTEIPLSGSKRAPKRIVHFCDGVLEEYSTEDEDEPDGQASCATSKSALVDIKTLSWVPYMLYLGYWLGAKTLSICDYLGENLAHFFGITTPKYQYEIEEYQRILQEEDEAQRREEEEKAAGWIASTTASTEQLTNIEVEPSPFRITLKKIPAAGPIDSGQQSFSSGVQWERF